jgi:hypothetical protein
MSPSERPGDHDPLDDDDGSEQKKNLFERAIPDVVKRVIERAVETGVEKVMEAPENIRELVAEMKLPKEAAHYVYDQIDDTKKGIYRIVAKEIRDVLEHINFADEIADVLTKLQFEINTTIRFVPNEQAHEEKPEGEAAEPTAGDAEAPKRPSGIPRPRVVSKMVMKARDALKTKE